MRETLPFSVAMYTLTSVPLNRPDNTGTSDESISLNPLDFKLLIISDFGPSTGKPRNFVTSFCAKQIAVQNMTIKIAAILFIRLCCALQFL